MASRLGRHLDTELLAALDRVLDVLGGQRDRDGGRKVRQADVEGSNILVPAIGALGVDGDLGLGETLLDGSPCDERIGRGGNQAGGKKSGDTHARQLCRDCDLRTIDQNVRAQWLYIYTLTKLPTRQDLWCRQPKRLQHVS